MSSQRLKGTEASLTFNSLPVKASQPAGSKLCMDGGNIILEA
jgi:hypothetical protein